MRISAVRVLLPLAALAEAGQRGGVANRILHEVVFIRCMVQSCAAYETKIILSVLFDRRQRQNRMLEVVAAVLFVVQCILVAVRGDREAAGCRWSFGARYFVFFWRASVVAGRVGGRATLLPGVVGEKDEAVLWGFVSNGFHAVFKFLYDAGRCDESRRLGILSFGGAGGGTLFPKGYVECYGFHLFHDAAQRV